MARIALALIGLVTSGCDGGGAGGVLFHDDFSGSFPEPNWVGDGEVETMFGAPLPALRLAPIAPKAFARVQMANPIQVGGGLVLRFSVAVPAESSGQIFLEDVQASGQPLAGFTFRGVGEIAYEITGIPGAVQPLGAHDGMFHEFELQYTKNGASSWSRDGAIQVQGTAVNQATLTRLSVQTGAVVGLVFDEVELGPR